MPEAIWHDKAGRPYINENAVKFMPIKCWALVTIVLTKKKSLALMRCKVSVVPTFNLSGAKIYMGKKYILHWATVFAALSLLGACKTIVQSVRHPANIMVTFGSGNRPYTSMGALSVCKTSSGFATMVSIGADFLVNGRYKNEAAKAAAEEFLTGELANAASGMGANAVIFASYSVSEVPILFPIFGPLALQTVCARGEAVQMR